MKTPVDKCPACGSENLWWGFFDQEGYGRDDDSEEGVEWGAVCNECGARAA